MEHGYALAVSSATAGHHAVALALNLGGSEVIVPPLTWGGSISGLLHVGPRPEFGDVEPDTLALCPDAARRAVRSATKAILAVDLFGVPADGATLRRIADDHGLWYIHDAAQSFGATRDGDAAGSHAHATVVSFTLGKTLCAGEGGAALTNDADLYARLLWLTQHPYRQRRELGLHEFNEFALNFRIHPLAAVWANADFDPALKRLRSRQKRMSALAHALDRSGLTAPTRFSVKDIRPSWGRMTAAWSAKPQTAGLLAFLRAESISARLGPARLEVVYRQGAYLAHWPSRPRGRCPEAETQSRIRFEIVEQPEEASQHVVLKRLGVRLTDRALAREGTATSTRT